MSNGKRPMAARLGRSWSGIGTTDLTVVAEPDSAAAELRVPRHQQPATSRFPARENLRGVPGAQYPVIQNRGVPIFARQNSLSCAHWCAALSLRIIPINESAAVRKTAGEGTADVRHPAELSSTRRLHRSGRPDRPGVADCNPSSWLSSNPTPKNSLPMNADFNAFDDARMKFDVRFYLVAILFIIFDLEVAFLFRGPWRSGS